jgi:hypothetical protein
LSTIFSQFGSEQKPSRVFPALDCRPHEQALQGAAVHPREPAHEAPELEALWQSYKDRDMVLIGVDYVDTPAGAFSYLRKFKITFPNAPDLQSAISSTLNRKMGVPETYFIDKQGVLRYVQVGQFASVEQIQGILDPLLAE